MTPSEAFEVWGFADVRAAQRTGHQFASTTGTGPVVGDAGVVSWPTGESRPTAWQLREIAEDPLSGAFWGLLFATLFLLPLTTQAASTESDEPSSPRSWAGDEGLRALGLDAPFVAAVRAGVTPGTSAMFLLLSIEASTQLDAAMPSTGLRIARLVLTPTEQLRIQTSFGD